MNRWVVKRTQYGTLLSMDADMSLAVVFHRTESGNEPVREWLQSLSKQGRQTIDGDIETVQYGLAYWDASRAKNGARTLGSPVSA